MCPAAQQAQPDDALRLRLGRRAVWCRGGAGRGGAGGRLVLYSTSVPGDAMGKKQVVNEPQVL